MKLNELVKGIREYRGVVRKGPITPIAKGLIPIQSEDVLAAYGEDAVGDVITELRASVQQELDAGVAGDRIVVDPGIGFSKRGAQSLAMLAQMRRFTTLGYPVLVGVSRKRFIGEITNAQTPADRDAGTAGANVVALERGARLFRVHDVKASRDALDVAWAIMQTGPV